MEKSSPHIVLETDGLQIGYRSKQTEKVVGSDISVRMKEGELVAVIGINGVGKSTFLRTLSGIQPPLQGRILIKEEDSRGLSSQRRASLISLVLTEQPVSKNLRVAELVALGRQPYTNWIGSLTGEDREKITSALKQVDIAPIQEKKCFELSDGQLQKVLIARALAQDTPIMVLDEPTSHLDLYHKAQVMKLLKELSVGTGKAIIFATHEVNLALQLCDQLIVMQSGSVLQGSPEQLIDSGALETIFPSDLIIFDPASRSFRIKT